MSSPQRAGADASLLDWLLEEDNPSIRFLTLTRLLGRSQRNPDVRAARAAIMRSGFVPTLLALQAREGCWGAPDSFYTAKYRGTVWQLMMLAEHHADGSDERVRRACEFILVSSQDPESGGFSQKRAKRAAGGVPSDVIPCLTGNMVWSLLRLGYLGDERVERGIAWLARYLRFDDGDSSPPANWPYNRWESCYGRHSCFMGVVKGLKALAEIPIERRSAAVRRTIDAGVEFMLRHHVYKRSHNLRRSAKPGWNHFGFPRMYQTDVLETMLVLRSLGVDDARMAEALALIQAKRGPDGRWSMEDSFNGKFQVDVERQGQASKWLTLHALWVLDQRG